MARLTKGDPVVTARHASGHTLSATCAVARASPVPAALGAGGTMLDGLDVDALRRLLPRPGYDPRLLARAARSGRVRGLALEAWSHALASPRAAGGILRRALRDARALHSRERRFVSDVLYDMVRATGALAPWWPDPAATFDAWLVHLGLPVDEAPTSGLADAVDLPAAWYERLTRLPDDAAAASLAGIPMSAGAELLRSLGRDLLPFLEASNGRAPVVLRTQGVDRDVLVARLRERGLDARPGRHAPTAVVLPTSTGVPPAFAREAEVQDEASQLVAALVRPRPGERILDACAGAGGKTLALGGALDGRGELWATDVRGQALGELKRRAAAAGVRVRTALLRDGVPSCDLGGPFDAVLVDAPCAGTGVWRRHPELRWRLDDLPGLTALQDRVLDDAAARVRPGGRLVYATCSVLRAEGEDRVEAFLARRPAWRLLPVEAAWPEVGPDLVTHDVLRTWPHRQGTDGFFAAVLRRA